MHRDYLDIVFIHSNGEDEKLIEEEQVFATLKALKSAGKIRAFGMSTKTVKGGLKTIDAADVAMITHHPLYTEEKAVIAYAKHQQKGIFIKKAFASGHLDKFKDISPNHPVETAFNFIFKEPGVTSIILGTINPKHLQENISHLPRELWDTAIPK